jgi:hypothetical protein
MGDLRFSRAYCLFLALGFAQLGALVEVGETRFSLPGLAVVLLAVVWLGHGSRAAWWLFVAGHGFVVLTALAVTFSSAGQVGLAGWGFGTGVIWPNVIALAGGSSAILATLLSPGMRKHLRGRPLPA